jgi:hypothetical protein
VIEAWPFGTCEAADFNHVAVAAVLRVFGILVGLEAALSVVTKSTKLGSEGEEARIVWVAHPQSAIRGAEAQTAEQQRNMSIVLS